MQLLGDLARWLPYRSGASRAAVAAELPAIIRTLLTGLAARS
jgi:hypothetical protein